MLMASTSLRNDSAWSTPSSPARAMNADVFGQAAAGEAETGVQEPASDAGVVGQRGRQTGDVGAGGLADLRHRVDERDLGGEKGVGGDLDELGDGEVGNDERDVGFEQRRVDGAHHGLAAAFWLDAENEPVGTQGVFDGETLAQELGVPDQFDAGDGGCGGDPLPQAFGGAGARATQGHQRPLVGDWYAFTLSFKGVVLEGLEVVFITVTFGSNQHNIPLAAAAAGAAVLAVVAAAWQYGHPCPGFRRTA